MLDDGGDPEPKPAPPKVYGSGSGTRGSPPSKVYRTDPDPEHGDPGHRFPSSDTYQDQGVETEVVKNEVECFLENMAQVESLWILKLNQR